MLSKQQQCVSVGYTFRTSATFKKSLISDNIAYLFLYVIGFKSHF